MTHENVGKVFATAGNFFYAVGHTGYMDITGGVFWPWDSLIPGPEFFDAHGFKEYPIGS